LNREARIVGIDRPKPWASRVRASVTGLTLADWLLAAGMIAIAFPTMLAIVQTSWSTEEGGHGPLVLVTGIWLIFRLWSAGLPRPEQGSAPIALAALAVCLAVYVLARITGIVEIEGFAMYGALIAAVYALWGKAVLKHFWFPIVYLMLILPPPESLVAAFTQPIKIIISKTAVDLLHGLGYPIASSGVTIQIGQLELLVAAACAGLNSIISLTAIGLFYIYVLHNANYRYAALLFLAILPAAIFANFARVLILILVTYHLGDAAAQGFIHNFAGVTMFVISLIAIFSVDRMLTPLRRRLGGTPNGD
jgi:exosortase